MTVVGRLDMDELKNSWSDIEILQNKAVKIYEFPSDKKVELFLVTDKICQKLIMTNNLSQS